MSSDPRFVRLAAWALVLGGAAVILNDATHFGFMALPEDPTPTQLGTSTAWLAHGFSHLVYGVLLAFAIVGLMATHAARLGRSGLAALAVVFVATLWMATAYTTMTLAGNAAPDAILGDEPPTGVGATFIGMGVPVGFASLTVFGLVIAWKRLFSRVAGIIVAVAVPAFFFAPIPGGLEAVAGGALVWLGLRWLSEVRRGVGHLADATTAPA